MKATVNVRLKGEVLDTQGRAVQHSLETLGIKGVKGVRIGKLIEIEFEPGTAEGHVKEQLEKACDELLANPVIEDFELEMG